MYLTWEQIQKMSDEEVAEMQRKLGRQAMKRFFMFEVVKWGLIIGVTGGLKRFAKKS